MIYFWLVSEEYGFLSNQFISSQPCPQSDAVVPSSEHAFMYLKALHYGDTVSALRILRADLPSVAKHIGRNVAGFDEKDWEAHREEAMFQALVAKFSNEVLKAQLLATGDAVLAEASPSDAIWGIGLSRVEALAGAAWAGLNTLDELLMRLRARLKEDEGNTPGLEVLVKGLGGSSEGAQGSGSANDLLDASSSPCDVRARTPSSTRSDVAERSAERDLAESCREAQVSPVLPRSEGQLGDDSGSAISDPSVLEGDTAPTVLELSPGAFQDLGIAETLAVFGSTDGDNSDVLDQIFTEPSPECMAAVALYWAAYCTKAANDVAQDKFAAVLGHAILQHDQFVRNKLLQRCAAERLARLPVSAISRLPLRLQREWAASAAKGGSPAHRKLACDVLRTWSCELTQLSCKHVNSTLVQAASSVFDEADSGVAHARPPDFEGFTYVEVFAGSSSFSERSPKYGGRALAFIEWESSDHPLLRALAPSAVIFSDFYEKRWLGFEGEESVDALLSWPMCKHLAACGLLKMEKDEVASQLWDTAELAEHLDVLMVAIENVLLLELGDAMHELLSKALMVFESRGFVLASVWRVNDAALGGHSWRTRPWILLHKAKLAPLVSPAWQPAMGRTPSSMRSCVLPLSQVEHLLIDSVDVVQPVGWRLGSFRFRWSSPLQPGTLVNVTDESWEFCVYAHVSKETVRVRSKDPRNPKFLSVEFDSLSPSGSLTKLRSLDSPCETVRSSPDPPGITVVLEDRLPVPCPRLLHEHEIWRIQTRSEQAMQLMLRNNLSRDQIIHKAGKAVTGCMADYMALAVHDQCAELRAASLGCISPLAEASRAVIRLIPIHWPSHSALVACQGNMLIGQYVDMSRDSASRVAAACAKALLLEPGYLALAGEEVVCQHPQWLFVCAPPSLSAPTGMSEVLRWVPLSVLKGSLGWPWITAAHLRLCEHIEPTALQLKKRLITGQGTSTFAAARSTVEQHSWEQQCQRATQALGDLQRTFLKAAESEESVAVKRNLFAWHSKIPSFLAESVPQQLRACIPKCTGFVAKPFPAPHKADCTEWLPLKKPQPKFCKRVSSIKDVLPGRAGRIYDRFQQKQEDWLAGKAVRPHMAAISELDAADFAQGRILDLRRLPEGIVTELDYSAPIPSKFNRSAIAEAFADYVDQEIVSFWVLGVAFKAELPSQMVFNRHLLCLLEACDEVFRDKAALAEEPFKWVGVFKDSPFFPARFNGNGQVPKGEGIRPTDEGGGPRTLSFDSRNVRVLSLNQYMDGVDLWIAAPLGQIDALQAEARSKWVAEHKPRVKHVRLSNAIIKEGADLCELAVYTFKLDWFKMFNQFALRPEEYWKSCHCFPQGFIANYCLTFGLSMASNVAQRIANAFVWLFLREFALLDAPFLEELRRRYPAFDKWCAQRGQAQAALLWMCCYTDDPLWVVAGADRMVRAVKLYHALAEKLGFLPASFDKFSIGIAAHWIGIVNHVFLGLTEVPEPKAAKAVLGLTAAAAGSLDSAAAISLLGLLEHCRDALALSSTSLFPMWYAVDRSDPAAPYDLSGVAAERAETMQKFLSAARGSAVVELVSEIAPQNTTLALSIFSDAALQPVEEAGMGGFIIGFVWRVAVSEGLWGVTIPVLELLAAGVNLFFLHALLGCPESGAPPMWIRWEVDALTAHFALKNDSAKSPLMRLVHLLITRSPAFEYFRASLVLCHVYGPGNPGDAPSRGKVQELVKLATALKFTLKWKPLPPAAMAMIEATVAGAELEMEGDHWATSQSFLVEHFSRISVEPLRPIRPDLQARPIDLSTALASPESGTGLLIPFRSIAKRSASQLQSPADVLSRLQPTLRPERSSPLHSATVEEPLRPFRPKKLKPTPAVAISRSDQLAVALENDNSPYALCPGNPMQLQLLCSSAVELLAKTYNLKTCRRDVPAFRKWAAYCRALGTTPWRDDAAANSGADPLGHQREIVLAINAMVHHQQMAKPRPAGSNRTLAKPDTAMAWLMAVRRVFKANMIPLLPLTQIRCALKSLCHEFIARFGQGSLMPKRAAPFSNEMLGQMLSCSGSLQVSPTVLVSWESWSGLNLRAVLAVARHSGMRKSELVSHEGSMALTVANVGFLFAGVLCMRPTAAQLDSLAAGDFLVIVPPPSKSDPFGVVWGSLPIYLPYTNERQNAARLVAQILKGRQGAAGSEPLFCLAPGKPFSHSFLDRALQKWMVSIGLSEAEAKLYSFHSARAHLACALAAANRTPDVIQALLRWQSVDSLRVYVALNPAAYAAHILAAQSATVSGIRGAHLPIIDSLQMAYQMQICL